MLSVTEDDLTIETGLKTTKNKKKVYCGIGTSFHHTSTVLSTFPDVISIICFKFTSMVKNIQVFQMVVYELSGR